MKLLLLAAALAAPALAASTPALGQSPAPSPAVASPAPAALAVPAISPAAAAPTLRGGSVPLASPHPAGAASDAAANVPLPDQPTSGTTLEKPMQLMPGGTAPNIPKPKKGEGGSAEPGAQPSPKLDPSNTFQAEADLHARIRIRQLYTQVINEPATQDEWAAAHRVKTDPERRTLLKTYYTHLYDRMSKLDPSMATRIENRKTGALWRLRYPRLEPDGGQDATPPPGEIEQPGVPPQ